MAGAYCGDDPIVHQGGAARRSLERPFLIKGQKGRKVGAALLFRARRRTTTSAMRAGVLIAGESSWPGGRCGASPAQSLGCETRLCAPVPLAGKLLPVLESPEPRAE